MSGPRRRWIVPAAVVLLGMSVPVDGSDAATQQPAERPLSIDDLARLDTLLAQEDATASRILDRHTLRDIAGLALVAGIGLYSFFRNSYRLKLVTLALSVVYLGFVKASLVSIVDVFGALQRNLPPFAAAVPYYLLLALTICTTVLWGRFYCGRICAFGALTQLMDRIVPARLRYEPPPWIDRRAAYLKYVVLFGAIGYVLNGGSPQIYRYIEPFWLFTLSGDIVMWTLAGGLLVATVLVRNLYCRYLCAVGAGLGVLSSLTLFPIGRWKECSHCTLCEKTCEWGAIRGPKIVKRECVRCDDCERLADNRSACPHWLRLARSSRGVRRIPLVPHDRASAGL